MRTTTGKVGATLTAAALAALLLGACGRAAPADEAQVDAAPDPAAQAATPSSATVDADAGSGDADQEAQVDQGEAMSDGTDGATADGSANADSGTDSGAEQAAATATAPVLTADSLVGVVDPTPGQAGVKITSQSPIVAPTPTTAPPPVPETVPAGTGGVHVVEPGDTLSGIAATYGVPVQAIAEANSLADVDNLKLGQELQIPPAG